MLPSTAVRKNVVINCLITGFLLLLLGLFFGLLLRLLLFRQLGFGHLFRHFPRSPRADVQIKDGIDDQEQVHGRNGDVVDHDVG